MGCLYNHKIIAPVGLERAYAAFAGMKAVAILSLYFAQSVPVLMLFRFMIGLNAAGLAIIVESWLNALVPNEQRGRVLTLYVLVYGLFYGAGQLLAQNLDVRGPEFLIISGISTTLALVPMVGINVRAPQLPQRVKLEILKAMRTSPASVMACLLNGLILTGFFTVGPLFGVRIGFDQQHVVILMACVSLGGLFLQWPIGHLSDKIDRLHALIGLGLGILAVAAALVSVDQRMPFFLIGILFAVFGGFAESLYAVGVAHANDRADKSDYVALSSTLLFVWALGAAIGPTTGTFAIQLISPSAFFGYVIVLTVALHSRSPLWRLRRRRIDRRSRSARDSSSIRRRRLKSTPGSRIIKSLPARRIDRPRELAAVRRILRPRRQRTRGPGTMHDSCGEIMTTRVVTVEFDDSLATVKEIFDSRAFPSSAGDRIGQEALRGDLRSRSAARHQSVRRDPVGDMRATRQRSRNGPTRS